MADFLRLSSELLSCDYCSTHNSCWGLRLQPTTPHPPRTVLVVVEMALPCHELTATVVSQFPQFAVISLVQLELMPVQYLVLPDMAFVNVPGNNPIESVVAIDNVAEKL